MRSPQGGPGPREGQRGAIDLARVKGGAVESWKEDEEDDSVGEMILGFVAGSDHGPYEGIKAFLTEI